MPSYFGLYGVIMKQEIRSHNILGKLLWMTDGKTEVAVALDFGIRVVHLSCAGKENLFYIQPEDLSDGVAQPNGWRLHGGHRFWLSPESDDSYFPDNSPVSYRLLEDGAEVTQEIDPLLGVIKSIVLRFLPSGGIELTHHIQNVSENTMTVALWGVNTLTGGEVEVGFSANPQCVFTPNRVVSLWGKTNLGDPRVTFEAERLLARHGLSDDYFKIGIFSRDGRAIYKNLGQQLTITFQALSPELYSDMGCNFELFMNRYFMELETLGIRHTLLPGDCASHKEVWQVANI